MQIVERKSTFLGNMDYDEVHDLSLSDYWARNLDKVYWETRTFRPNAGWPTET